jgi:NADH-dependent peroxiredoxin subunit F
MKDLIIIGGAPAGAAAAVYAARKRLDTLLVTEEFGGQSSVSETIYNWIGTNAISGADLAKNLEKHVMEYTDPEHTLSVKKGVRVEMVSKIEGGFNVQLSNGTDVQTRSVLVASGSSRRKLEVPGADTYEHKGVMYCATCDGPLFSGQAVVVVGGGNAALEAVLQLSQYASHVTLLHRSENFRADQLTIDKVAKLPNVTMLKNIELLEIKGATFVSSISFKDKITGEATELPIGGVFVEIGQIPNTSLVKDIATLDEHGKVVVDPMNQRTTTDGIWAAGDCTNGLYHQNNIAAGDAVKAIEDLYIWLKKNT